jgi:iron complex outermembrane recepter protein
MRFATLLATSVSLAALAAAPAHAQPPSPANEPAGTETAAAEDPGDADIVVTGLRASLESAQNVKRLAPQVVDAIVASDIGKLPDLAVSDTVGRLPGVQVYRQAGEASRVLIRGLPDFATTYNGREIFTAETRVVALQDFPSANIAALEVFKTSTADLVSPGLAGLVNVRSRRPFDFEGGQIAGSVWGLYTLQAEKLTPNFNLLATKRWETGAGEFGLLVNGSYTELQYLDSEPSNTDFLQTFRQEGTRLIADGAGQAARFPDIQRLFYRSGNRARPSVNAAAQWRPNPDLEIYADFLWQGFRNKIDDRLVAVELFGGSDYSNLVFRPNSNLLSSGTVVGAPNSVFTFQGGTYNKTNTFQYAGGAKYDNGQFKISADLAYTKSTFTGSTESVDRRFVGTPTITFDLERPQFDIAGLNPLDPNAFIFAGLFEENQRSSGRDWQGRIDAQYDFDEDFFIRNIQVGARFTDREAIRQYANRFAGPLTPTSGGALPLTFRPNPEGFKGAGDLQPFRRFATPTYESIRKNREALRQLVGFSTTPVPRQLLYTADEKTYAGYAQLVYGFGESVDGQIGVRVERTETRVAGAQPTGIEAIDRGNEYTDWLPNASIRFRPMPELQLRLSYAQTRTRPNFVDQQPNIVLGPAPPGGVGTDSAPYPATGGNPFLQPFTSDNYDASLEYYFGPTSFASIAVFRRELDGFIQQSSFRFTDPNLGVVQVIGRTNTGKGRITGVEAQLQTFFDYEFLPDWARGFGVQANVTYLDAKTQQPVFGGPPGALEFDRISFDDGIRNGVSKWNFNFVGLYERGPLSARLTYTGRSNFLAFRDNRGTSDPYREFGDPNDRLDLSVNYNILENLTVFADWTNITMNPFKVNFSSARDGRPEARYPRYLRYDESTVSLGVRFRFGS